MDLTQLITPFPWAQYSKKLVAKIERPKNFGSFDPAESEERGMRSVEAEAGSLEEGNFFKLYWLVDKADGVIVDAKFQVFGQSALIGALETACELVLHKNYDQARRISADLIDKQVRDQPKIPAFPQDTYFHLNLVIEAIDSAAAECYDLPLAESYVAPPVPVAMREALIGGYPGWSELSTEQKLSVIEEVLERDVRPYIALDGGGVEVLKLEKEELHIAYQGNCTSCFSSVGSTLSYIQQVLRAQAHPDLVVIPSV